MKLVSSGEEALSGERVERRLAAILGRRRRGLSRLMGADEEGTLAALKALRRELVDPRSEHRGRIVKTTGDGLLVEFASVVDAVRCAVEVQREMAQRNEAWPRNGASNSASASMSATSSSRRTTSSATASTSRPGWRPGRAGGICVSRVVRDQVRDKLDFAFDDLGEQQVKNIARPVRVFASGSTERGAGKAGRQDRRCRSRQALDRGAAVPEYERRSGAGIFRRRHGRGNHHRDCREYHWLFVIARNSTFTYKGKAVDVKQVGRNWACATCSKAACARPATGCASPAS